MAKLRHLGVMLDVSRNGVMKLDCLKEFIDILSKMGYNALELYMEDTYMVEGEPYFGYLRGRYTDEEIQEVDRYAKSKGIELIPCIQALAHYTNMAKLPFYGEIIDINDILLIDEPKTYIFLDKVFASLAKNYTSRLVNIGMDEAHMMGLGRYLQKHGYSNRQELFVRHLQKVIKIAEKYGFKAHMWSDMFYRLATDGNYYEPNANISPELKALVPENVDLVYWDYYHHDKKLYDGMLQSHQTFEKNIWFAGGAWVWDGFAPLNWLSLDTMKPAFESIHENGIKDVIITLWGDDGAECSVFSVLPSLYAISQYAKGNFDGVSIAKSFAEMFGIAYDDFLTLDLPNKLYKKVVDYRGEEFAQNPCKVILYQDLFMGRYDHTIQTEEKELPYCEYKEKLAKVAEKAGEYYYLFDCMSLLCAVLEIKGKLGIKTRYFYRQKNKERLSKLLSEYEELESRLRAFMKAFQVRWFKENKGQGWEVQDARLGGLIQRVKTCKARLLAYTQGEIEKIEELEEEILPWIDGFQDNTYRYLITTSNM